MSFKFSLESVLKHRKRLEEIAQREFAEAQASVDALLRKIEAMYARLDEVREEILGAQKAGSAAKLEEIREMEHFMAGQKIRIETLRQEARVLLQIAEEKQELLIAAARDKKMLVKLKEKKKLEYQEWLKTVEQKELDDMTMVRQAWGKK
jgi:flagellar FliJ protein